MLTVGDQNSDCRQKFVKYIYTNFGLSGGERGRHGVYLNIYPPEFLPANSHVRHRQVAVAASEDSAL